MNPVQRNEVETWKRAGEAAGGVVCRGKAQWDTVKETAGDRSSSELKVESPELLHHARVTAKKVKQC